MIEKIKRILGKPIIVDNIVDMRKYPDNCLSYAGNSLMDANVLIIIKDDIILVDEIYHLLKAENCTYVGLKLNSEESLTVKKIYENGREILGPFNHIINFYYFDNNVDEKKLLRTIYQHLQIEVQYLIDYAKKGSICTVVIYDECISDEIRATIKGAESLIEGLGIVLPNHQIIGNGIIAQSNIPLSEVVKSAIYLSSKYGQILTGEVLKMHN